MFGVPGNGVEKPQEGDVVPFVGEHRHAVRLGQGGVEGVGLDDELRVGVALPVGGFHRRDAPVQYLGAGENDVAPAHLVPEGEDPGIRPLFKPGSPLPGSPADAVRRREKHGASTAGDAMGKGDLERLEAFLRARAFVDETGSPLSVLLEGGDLVRIAPVGKVDLACGVLQLPVEPVPAFRQDLGMGDPATLPYVDLVGHPPVAALFMAENRRVAESGIPAGVAMDGLCDALRAAQLAHDVVKPVESLVVEQKCCGHGGRIPSSRWFIPGAGACSDRYSILQFRRLTGKPPASLPEKGFAAAD